MKIDGDKLVAARERKGWNPTQLAAAAGVSVSTVSRVERSIGDPAGYILVQLAVALGIHAEELYVEGVAR